ncbi:MAG: hypothetical protein FJX72_05850 [Armatimonadetes bacterium]|nr:hypothetical protein [Armatimonadota bacterium]
MASRKRKVGSRDARRARSSLARVVVSPGDVARLASRWPWVRQLALRRAEAADPLVSDRRCLELMIESLASPWTRNAARRALVTWLSLVSNQGGLSLDYRQLAALRNATFQSLPYRHAGFVIATLGALARLDDVEGRVIAMHFLADVEPHIGTTPPYGRRGSQPRSTPRHSRPGSSDDYADTFRQVRDAAAACLRRLDKAQERLRRRGSLVSPADPPTDVLLRPAEAGIPSHDPNLVRPASPPETRRDGMGDAI